VSKALQGESLKAADLASLSAAAFEDAVAHMDSAAADQAPDSGGAGNTGGGWSAAHQTASTQPLKLANVVETGDVAISRQLGEQLAQRMGEQIAQRVMNKLAQGEWQFKFVINPKNLGEIQVNLRMHTGGLDGAFIANQSATREMLGESMQRLRDVLNGLGMNVASLDVGADHSSRQGRQSMASGQTVLALEPQGLQQSTQETMAARRADLRGGDQGWDVLV
jgi:flagellar hook-length control protein FliK